MACQYHANNDPALCTQDRCPMLGIDLGDGYSDLYSVFGRNNALYHFFEKADPRKITTIARALFMECHLWNFDPIRGPLGEFNRLNRKINKLIRLGVSDKEPAGFEYIWWREIFPVPFPFKTKQQKGFSFSFPFLCGSSIQNNGCLYHQELCMTCPPESCVLRTIFPPSSSHSHFKVIFDKFGVRESFLDLIGSAITSLEVRQTIVYSLIWEAQQWVEHPDDGGPFFSFCRLKRRLAVLKRNKRNSEEKVSWCDDAEGSSSNVEGVVHASWKKSSQVFDMTFGSVRSVVVDPSDNFVCMGFADGTIKIWDSSINVEKLTLVGHTGQVRGVAFDNKRPFLFSVDDDSDDNSVKLWDIEYKKVIYSYKGHYSGIYSLALHPTLDILLTGGADSVCRMWDIRCRKQILALCGHEKTVSSIFTGPTDPQVITGSYDSTIKLWDLGNLKEDMRMTRLGRENTSSLARGTLKHHEESVLAMAPHPTDDCFVSASADNIKKFQLPRGEFMHNMPSRQKTIINSVAVNKEGVLATAGDDGGLWFWDWTRGYNFQQIKVQDGLPKSAAACIHSITYDIPGVKLYACGDQWTQIWTEDKKAPH